MTVDLDRLEALYAAAASASKFVVDALDLQSLIALARKGEQAEAAMIERDSAVRKFEAMRDFASDAKDRAEAALATERARAEKAEAERDALRAQQEDTHALAKRVHAAVVALREESRRLFPTRETDNA